MEEEFVKSKIYLYDGSFEGLLTAVFDAWNDKTLLDIRPQQAYECGLLDDTVLTVTDPEKFERVRVWLRKKIGSDAFLKVYRAFLTESESCEKIIFDYIKLAAVLGKNVDRHLASAAVDAIDRLERAFCNESHKMYGFLRFKESTSGVLYAKIGTKYNQLEPLIVFFHDRLPGKKLIIYDENRKLAAVCDGDAWYITDAFDSAAFDTEDLEEDFELLWKSYLDELSIKERENYKLQRQMMPLRYRPYMTEFSGAKKS